MLQAISKKENRISPTTKPDRTPANRNATDQPRSAELKAPNEPAPQAPVPTIKEVTPIPSPEVKKDTETKETKTAEPPATATRSVPNASPTKKPTIPEPAAPVGNYPDKNDVVSKLKNLDDLLEDLELDFTDVMLSEDWGPIRSIVKQLSQSFAD